MIPWRRAAYLIARQYAKALTFSARYASPPHHIDLHAYTENILRCNQLWEPSEFTVGVNGVSTVVRLPAELLLITGADE